VISLTIKPTDIKRGDIWIVDLNPTIGSEIQKTRPVVVISSDAIGVLPIRLIAPITGWNDRFDNSFWHIKLVPDNKNNLLKPSSVDSLQLRGVDIKRFISKVGTLPQSVLEEIVTAIAAVIEYQ
jgi:mRNA interferase MazF